MTQPNLLKTKILHPFAIQPNPWVNPTHGQLCDTVRHEWLLSQPWGWGFQSIIMCLYVGLFSACISQKPQWYYAFLSILFSFRDDALIAHLLVVSN